MKFDVVIGNPPFQSPTKGTPLWKKFWKMNLNLGHTVHLITPTTWLSGGELWDAFEKRTSHADVLTVKQHFKGVGSSFGRVCVDTSTSEGLSFSCGSTPLLGIAPRDGVGFDEIHQQLSRTNNLGTRCCISKRHSQAHRVAVCGTRAVREDTVELLKGVEQPNNPHGIIIHCTDKQQAKHVRQRVLECAKILNKTCRYAGWLDKNIVSMIRYDSP